MSKCDHDPIGDQPYGAEQARTDVRRGIQQIRALVVDYGNKLMVVGTPDGRAVRPAIGHRPDSPSRRQSGP